MTRPSTPPSEDDTIVDFRTIPNNTHECWWLDPGLRWNMFYCVGLYGTLFFNGYDGSLFNGLQSIEQWEKYFDNPSSNILGLMNSAGFLPGILASFFSDRLAFYLGRRVSVWVGSCIVIVGAIVMSLSNSVGMFCGGRVLLGFGTSTALTVAPSMLQEFAHPRLRAQIGAFYTCIYYIAAIISAGVCLGCLDLVGQKSWRIPCFLQLVGPIFTLAITCTIPESPRWLAKNGKTDEARDILVKYHANGREDDELVAYEFREIEQALEFENENRQVRYRDLFVGRANIHRMAINLLVAVGTNWLGNGVVSYYLSPILTSLGIGSSKMQLKIMLGLQSWNLIVSGASAFSVDHLGRRPLWLISTGGMLVTFAVIMGLSAGHDETGSTSIGMAAIPFFFLFYGCYSVAWTPLAYSYPVEILPYSLRTKGQALYITTQTLAVSVNTWVNPVAFDALKWRYYAVYLAIQLFLLIVIWFYFPETKNLTIEEITNVFDKAAKPVDARATLGSKPASIFQDESMDKED